MNPKFVRIFAAEKVRIKADHLERIHGGQAFRIATNLARRSSGRAQVMAFALMSELAGRPGR